MLHEVVLLDRDVGGAVVAVSELLHLVLQEPLLLARVALPLRQALLQAVRGVVVVVRC